MEMTAKAQAGPGRERWVIWRYRWVRWWRALSHLF